MNQNIKQAAILIKSGKIVAFPTETVYGLGVDYLNEQALISLFELKRREKNKPFTLHVNSISQIENVAMELQDSFYELANAFFPGPLMLIVKAKKEMSKYISHNGTIGIRYPDHNIALMLIKAVGRPIAATSANISKKNDAICEEEVKNYFPKLPMIIGGGTTKFKKYSTILNLTSEHPIILREGVITKKQIKNVLKKIIF